MPFIPSTGASAEWFQRIRLVLQRQMSEHETPGLQFEDRANAPEVWFRPRVYRWRERPGPKGMTEWRPNVKPRDAR